MTCSLHPDSLLWVSPTLRCLCSSCEIWNVMIIYNDHILPHIFTRALTWDFKDARLENLPIVIIGAESFVCTLSVC